ncbi:MAG: tetratricopeptide repeat protein [Phycisphaerales bacterium]|jgi:tetratricopeptide (TPR) repeat protein|nr:tetratricopeptide repeat protein [Phycisphaerales bacterium]
MSDWFEAERHVERAHEHFDAGRWEQAESELREALSFNPEQAEWQFNLGLTLDAAGRFGDAADAFRRAHELDPSDEQAAIMAAAALIDAGHSADALTFLDRAARIDRDSVEVQVHRVVAHARLGELEKAELAFFLGQQLAPDHAELYLVFGEALLDAGQHERAIGCLREAARLDERLPRVKARLAEAFGATGRFERARQLYLEELRIDPGDIDTILDLGCLLIDMNRPIEAGEKFRRVLELEPDNAEASFHLAELAARTGDVQEAIRLLDLVTRLDPEHREAARQLAGLLARRGTDRELVRARRLIESDVARLGEDPCPLGDDELGRLVDLLLDARLPADAVRASRLLAARRPEDARVQHALGLTLLEFGDAEGGIEASRRAHELDPGMVEPMHNLAIAHLRQGQWTRARYWVRKAIKADPDDPWLRRLRLRLAVLALFEVVAWASAPLRRGLGAIASSPARRTGA